MNDVHAMVRFACPNCNERLKSPTSDTGAERQCPQCSMPLTIPAQSQAMAAPPSVLPVATPAQQKEATVPLNLALPKNLGGLRTHVSQSTANDLTKIFTGGCLVMLGVVLAAMFGIRWQPKA